MRPHPRTCPAGQPFQVWKSSGVMRSVPVLGGSVMVELRDHTSCTSEQSTALLEAPPEVLLDPVCARGGGSAGAWIEVYVVGWTVARLVLGL
jgi:hypothetical protein